MDDIFQSIKAHLYERTSSPLLVAFVISWAIWNYKFLIAIFAAENAPLIFQQIGSLRPSIFDTPLLEDINCYKFFSDLKEVLSSKVSFHIFLPASTTLLYFYVLPWLAKKIYNKDLENKKALRKIKQEIEGEQLLSRVQSQN